MTQQSVRTSSRGMKAERDEQIRRKRVTHAKLIAHHAETVELRRQLWEAHEMLLRVRESTLLGFPDDAVPYYNASNDPCDMLEGPCRCGAWHSLPEWLDGSRDHQRNYCPTGHPRPRMK